MFYARKIEQYISMLMLLGVLCFIIPYAVGVAIISAIFMAVMAFCREIAEHSRIFWRELNLTIRGELKYPWRRKS